MCTVPNVNTELVKGPAIDAFFKNVLFIDSIVYSIVLELWKHMCICKVRLYMAVDDYLAIYIYP